MLAAHQKISHHREVELIGDMKRMVCTNKMDERSNKQENLRVCGILKIGRGHGLTDCEAVPWQSGRGAGCGSK